MGVVRWLRPLRPEATRTTDRAAGTRWSDSVRCPWASARFRVRTDRSSRSSSRTRARCSCGIPSTWATPRPRGGPGAALYATAGRAHPAPPPGRRVVALREVVGMPHPGHPGDSEYGECRRRRCLGCDPPAIDARSAVLGRIGRLGRWRRLRVAAGRRDLIGACARGTHHCLVRPPGRDALTCPVRAEEVQRCSSMTQLHRTARVTGGVDTHSETHHAAVLDRLGGTWATGSSRPPPAGYRALLRWMRAHGQLAAGRGRRHRLLRRRAWLRHLHRGRCRGGRGRPPGPADRARADGKSDPIDAYAAARPRWPAPATVVPKTRDGIVEAIRILRVTRRGAVKARTQTINQLKSLLRHRPGRAP